MTNSILLIMGGASNTTIMWLAFIVLSVISFIVSKSVQTKFKSYSRIPMN